MVLLSETKEKFISDYEVMEYRIPDSQLGALSVENHERIFGEAPEVLAGDKGFNPKAPARAALEEKVETLAIPGGCRTGRRSSDWFGSDSGWGSKGLFRS